MKAREGDWGSQIDDANLHIAPCDIAQVNSVYGECSSVAQDERDIRKVILSPCKTLAECVGTVPSLSRL